MSVLVTDFQLRRPGAIPGLAQKDNQEVQTQEMAEFFYDITGDTNGFELSALQWYIVVP
jgi:hypothetical protein